MEEKIFDRLLLVLDGRKPNRWVNEIGIDRSAIRIIKDRNSLPGPDTLVAIRRAEGIDLVWFMEGKGVPFSVQRFESDEDRAESICEQLAEENWTVTIATDGQRHVAVLSQPGETESFLQEGVEGKRSYTIAEIIPGLQKKSLDAITERGKDLRLAEIPSEQIEAIFTGHAGTYRLLNEATGWLRGARPITAQHPIFTAAAPTPRHLTHDEEHLIKLYGRMAAEHRATYKAIGTTLAQQDADKKSREAAD